MNQKADKCEQVKQFILKNQMGNLNEDEISELNTHLATCTGCRLLQKTIAELPDIFAILEDAKPLPRPEIKQVLLQRFVNPGFMKRPGFDSRLDFLLAILKRPVPLYQTAMAISLAVVISISSFIIFSKGRDHTDSPGREVSVQTGRPDHDTYYYPSPHTLPHRVGVNAAEDTSFQSILFTAL